MGRRTAENFNLKGLHRLDINDYLFTFFLFVVINVLDYFYVCIILEEKQNDKQWSGTGTIISHILPSKPETLFDKEFDKGVYSQQPSLTSS